MTQAPVGVEKQFGPLKTELESLKKAPAVFFGTSGQKLNEWAHPELLEENQFVDDHPLPDLQPTKYE